MASVFLSSEIPNGMKCRVALTAISLLLAGIISAGCGRSEPIESAAQATDESVAQGSTGGAEVIATTSGGPAEREATTGVASTTAQDEASDPETSAPGTSKALAKIPTLEGRPPSRSLRSMNKRRSWPVRRRAVAPDTGRMGCLASGMVSTRDTSGLSWISVPAKSLPALCRSGR